MEETVEAAMSIEERGTRRSGLLVVRGELGGGAVDGDLDVELFVWRDDEIAEVADWGWYLVADEDRARRHW